jgi:aryl-alcohol dehydrogenase-like predicted oxidoreductase
MTSSTSLPRRLLGSSRLSVSRLGLGCMGMSEFYGARDDARSIRTIHHALHRGINFFDTADMYGPYINEELLGRALQGRRDGVVIATKCGFVRDPANPGKREINNRPEYIKASCEGSLRRLGVETIDLYYLHRYYPPSASIEEAVGAMADLVRDGKVRALGLSEVSAATLAKACAVHPISALQTEYSLWSREPEHNGVLDACRDLGVTFVPYSPLSRGFLSGAIVRREDFAPDDVRQNMPRFSAANFEKNLDLVKTLERLGVARGATATQLALAWVLAQGQDIVPIPGTTKAEHLDELIAASSLLLSPDELAAIDSAFPLEAASGDRYLPVMRAFLDH